MALRHTAQALADRGWHSTTAHASASGWRGICLSHAMSMGVDRALDESTDQGQDGSVLYDEAFDVLNWYTQSWCGASPHKWVEQPGRTQAQVFSALRNAADLHDVTVLGLDYDAMFGVALPCGCRSLVVYDDGHEGGCAVRPETPEPADDVPELGYGCRTCGPAEYCPDDAMERYWDLHDGGAV